MLLRSLRKFLEVIIRELHNVTEMVTQVSRALKNGSLTENISTFEKEILFRLNTPFLICDIRMSTSPDDYMTPIKTIILKER